MKKWDKLDLFMMSKPFGMLKPASGQLKYPFVDPGEGYSGSLWDWDSYWSTFGLIHILEEYREELDYEKQRELLILHGKGCVLNFLDTQLEDGFIPIMASADGGESSMQSFLIRQKQESGMNQHKPFLCQFAWMISEYCGDFLWFDYEKLIRYLSYYEQHQQDQASGLFFWENDIMIGVDNNPTVFGRPKRSSADIYLNCFLYREYQAIYRILCQLGDRRAADYQTKSRRLCHAIQTELYDERDGFFYTGDILIETQKTEVFHHGLGVFWHVLPIKIRFWGGFLPMMCGITHSEQNTRLVREHYLDPHFLTDYGIRTLASNEFMYNTECSSNPSNWLGPIWGISTYCVFHGLLKGGFVELAAELVHKTERLFSRDLERSGNLSESYVPETGEQMMHNGFLSWNCLLPAMRRELRGRFLFELDPC